MNKKTIILITAILSFSLGQSLRLPSIASTDLQSTGRIVVTNPDTGNEEIIFDAKDQEKLKNNITANASEILDLKEWQEQQLEINQELSDKAFELENKDAELETEIELINDNLGGLQFGIDENGNYGYIKAGADTVTPFNNPKSMELLGSKNAKSSSVSITVNSGNHNYILLKAIGGQRDTAITTYGFSNLTNVIFQKKFAFSQSPCMVGTSIALVGVKSNTSYTFKHSFTASTGYVISSIECYGM